MLIAESLLEKLFINLTLYLKIYMINTQSINVKYLHRKYFLIILVTFVTKLTIKLMNMLLTYTLMISTKEDNIQLKMVATLSI